MDHFNIDDIQRCPIDALQLLNRTRIKTDLIQLRRLLKNSWKLKNQKYTLCYHKLVWWGMDRLSNGKQKAAILTFQGRFLPRILMN